MSVFKAACLTIAGTLVFGAATANAQDFFQRDRHTSVQQRQQPEFDPEPIRLGGLIATPSIAAGIYSDDNIFALPTGEESDTIITIDPRVALRTNWSRNEIGAVLDIRHREYSDFGNESATDIRAKLRGRLDVARGISLEGEVNADRIYENRRAISSQRGFEAPIEFRVLNTQLAANFQRSRLKARTTLSISDIDFEDGRLLGSGLIVDEDFRDNVWKQLQTRVSYAISPDVAFFGQADVGSRDYDTTFDALNNEINRDSTIYGLAGGVDFELPSLFRGDIAVGYFKDRKDGIGFNDVSGLSIDGQLEWFPTELTTVTLTSARRTVDPGIVESPGATATDFGVRVDHELKRNIILYANARRTNTDFEDFSRTDNVNRFGFGGIYKMNRRIHANAYFDRYNRQSDFTPSEFEQNIFGVRLLFYP